MLAFLLATLLCLLSLPVQAATTWKPLAPGIDYANIVPWKSNPWGHVHAFRIDLKYYRLNLAFAKDQNNRSTNVQQLATQYQAVLAVNGGFFTPDLQPIGLRIQDGKIRSRLKATSWWGVFYIKHSKPYLAAQQSYRSSPNISFAVQGGPRLIVNGQIPKLKEGDAERTAIGITRNNKIIIVATDNAPMTTTELAALMAKSGKDNGLSCYNALNLDGGHSTQMYANIGSFNLKVSGFSSITDAVLVLPKQTKTKQQS